MNKKVYLFIFSKTVKVVLLFTKAVSKLFNLIKFMRFDKQASFLQNSQYIKRLLLIFHDFMSFFDKTFNKKKNFKIEFCM